jgi:S-adenosylmethionine:tRNA ribosyltransferase-isomerase
MDPYKEPDTGCREGYQCLVKAAKKPQSGSVIFLKGGVQGQILTPVTQGKAQIRFSNTQSLLSILEKIGEVPLPPYIRRNGNRALVDDVKKYQTVYARKPGAVAAPTAGLHFSQELMQELENKGVELLRVTLHVGYGTFSPIRAHDIRDHSMHAEYAEISVEAAERIEKARRQGRRIVAVGTTVVRILEWVACRSDEIAPFSGFCNHYIYPGYSFRVVGAMITNFHLPRSSLLLLVSAFAGRDTILNAYSEAVQNEYRFFSYGDAMLIL